MKLIKIGNRYINPEKISVVYEYGTNFGNGSARSTIVVVGSDPEEYAMTEEDIDTVVKKITQEGGTKNDVAGV